MILNVWNNEGKWITKNINLNNVNCLHFTIKNKKQLIIEGKVNTTFNLDNGETYFALEDEIDWTKMDLWAKKFFVEINENKTIYDLDKNLQYPDNILKVNCSLYVNLDNLKNIEPCNFEKGIQKNGIKLTFLNGQTVKTRISKKRYSFIENYFKKVYKKYDKKEEKTF